MTQQNHRLNTVITQALNTSPYSRDVHDKYAVQQKSCGYGWCDNPQIGLSPVDINLDNAKPRMVLNMNYDNLTLVTSAHQQYAHMYNLQRKENNKLCHDPAYISLDTAIAQNVIEEIFALSDQVEGPLKAFMKDKKDFNIQNNDFYKAHFSDPKYNVVYNLYLSGALDEPYIKGNDTYAMLDKVTHLFNRDPKSSGIGKVMRLFNRNWESKKDKKKKNDFFANGRKALVKGLLQYNGKADADFIGETIAYAITDFEKANAARHNRQKNAKGTQVVWENDLIKEQGRKTPMRLSIMQEILNRPDNTFLEASDWNDILKTSKTTHFVKNIVDRSKYSGLYDQVKQETQDKYKAHVYTP